MKNTKTQNIYFNPAPEAENNQNDDLNSFYFDDELGVSHMRHQYLYDSNDFGSFEDDDL